MAKRSFAVRTLTPTAFADAANLTNDVHFGVMQGGAATQKNAISEIMLGGQAGASAPTFIVAGMNSTAATVVVVGIGEEAPLDGATADLAAPVDIGTSSTILAQRSATLGHILQLSFNAFGGIVRWLAPPGGEIGMVGLAVDTGSFSLSAFTGGTPGLMSSHIIYESL
jgi:hypothetical protein